jgi:hypothetical protein
MIYTIGDMFIPQSAQTVHLASFLVTIEKKTTFNPEVIEELWPPVLSALAKSTCRCYPNAGPNELDTEYTIFQLTLNTKRKGLRKMMPDTELVACLFCNWRTLRFSGIKEVGKDRLISHLADEHPDVFEAYCDCEINTIGKVVKR